PAPRPPAQLDPADTATSLSQGVRIPRQPVVAVVAGADELIALPDSPRLRTRATTLFSLVALATKIACAPPLYAWTTRLLRGDTAFPNRRAHVRFMPGASRCSPALVQGGRPLHPAAVVRPALTGEIRSTRPRCPDGAGQRGRAPSGARRSRATAHPRAARSR